MSGAEGEGGKHTHYLARGVSRFLQQQRPVEVTELCSDRSSSASSQRNGHASAYGFKSNQEVKKGGGEEY